MLLAGQEGHRRTEVEEVLAISPTTSAEHSTVSWPNCNSMCSTRPTTLGMERERSPQSMADTSSSLWDTRGVIASSGGRGGKTGLLTDGSTSWPRLKQAHTRRNLFHTVCLEADATSKTLRRCPFGFLTTESKHHWGSSVRTEKMTQLCLPVWGLCTTCRCSPRLALSPTLVICS